MSWLKFNNILEKLHCFRANGMLCFDSEKIDCIITKDNKGDLLLGSQLAMWGLPILSSLCFTFILLFTFAINTT